METVNRLENLVSDIIDMGDSDEMEEIDDMGARIVEVDALIIPWRQHGSP